MSIFLDFAYTGLLAAASPWLAYKAAATGKYRKGIGQKLGFVPRRQGDRPCLWLHGVSVGEVLALRTVVDALARKHPDWELVISTTTVTGMDVARRTYPDLLTFYYPLDFSWAVRRAIDRIRPTAIGLVELEVWPNFIWAAAERRVPVGVVNGRLSDSSYPSYQRARYLFRHVMNHIRTFGVQTQTYADRFIDIGADPGRLSVTGTVKYDGVLTERDHPRTRELARLLDVRPEDRVLIAASTQDPEESLALDVFQRLKPRYPDLRLIVVPRHKERFDEVARMLVSRTRQLVRRSTLVDEPLQDRLAVVLLDTLGELQYLYGLGDIVFVGGSLTPRGGQSMLEPAGMGCAVTFGPNTWNFRATVEQLLSVDGARVVYNADDLAAAVADLLDHPDEAHAMGARAQQMITSQKGATDRTVALLEQLMTPASRV